MKITSILRAEHAVFHNLFDYIERISPTVRTVAEIKSLARLTESLLAAHSKTEDELFIEPLEHCFEQVGQRETFHDEHEAIDRALAAVQKAREAKAARKQLLAVVLAARKHFDKEERIVFPMAERVLKAATLTDLGEQWLRRREKALK
jgi:hemerythrin-like domain-containing protein